MEISDLIISIILIIGIGLVLYLILRDPIYMLKSFLRGLKSHPNLAAQIVFLPIWLPAWIIDEIFGLKLFIKEFEDASKPAKISFSEYDKYLLINTANVKHIETILNSFSNEYHPKKYNYRLNGCIIKSSDYRNNTVLRFENEIEFKSFHHLIHYLDNSAPQDTVYNVKGILINKSDRDKSYCIHIDTAFSMKLIGKTCRNKKMYVDINPRTELIDTIFFNSNMDYFKNFNFDKFENEIYRLKFKELKLKPSP